MRFPQFLAAFLAVLRDPALALVAGRDGVQIHEQRATNNELDHWQKHSVPAADLTLVVRIGLAQRNLHRAEEYLLDVSHPDSPNYGRHWTLEQVRATFAPAATSEAVVKKWLVSSGIDGARLGALPSGWLTFNATVRELEALLHTKYHTFKHASTGIGYVACDDYSLPVDLRPHIDFITPTVHFDVDLRAFQSSHRRKRVRRYDGKGSGVRPNGEIIYNDVSDCDDYMTPACLRELYGYPLGSSAHPDNSAGIWVSPGIQYSSFTQEDNEVWYNFTGIPHGTTPIVNAVASGFAGPAIYVDGGYTIDIEAEIDLQTLQEVVYPLNVTVFAVGNDGSFNTWLDAVDKAYFEEQGDTSPIDPIFPNQTYNGQTICGLYKPTKVMSISYGYIESALTPAYMLRQCHEYLKLGLLGSTIIFADGDTGVAANGNTCDGDERAFSPIFPASCPWVTAVGATQIPSGGTLNTPQEAAYSESLGFYTGGGFSNIFTPAHYQTSTLNSYFTEHNPPYNASKYNATGRGYPDVSAYGQNMTMAYTKAIYRERGTSMAAQLFAGIITLINEQRLQIGKSTVGFINPIVYQHPEMFTDVTHGNNPGCDTTGFDAVQGWDPVTGMGTLKWKPAKDVWMGLP